MDITERVIKLREEKELSQEKFASELGLSRNFINQVENKKKNFSDRTISDICSKFGINEDWLRTGTGKMFIERTKDEQISEMISDILENDEETFKRRLISALAKLDNVGWQKLEELIDEISKK